MINELTKALQDHLTTALSHLLLRAPSAGGGEEYAPPSVYLGALPPKENPEDPERAPYVVVRAAEGKLEEKDGLCFQSVVVSLACGVYSPESLEAGEQDSANLVRWCVAALSQARVLEGRFELLSLNWLKPQEQNPPYYQAQVDTRWRFPEPPASLDPDTTIEIYGSGY